MDAALTVRCTGHGELAQVMVYETFENVDTFICKFEGWVAEEILRLLTGLYGTNDNSVNAVAGMINAYKNKSNYWEGESVMDDKRFVFHYADGTKEVSKGKNKVQAFINLGYSFGNSKLFDIVKIVEEDIPDVETACDS